MNTGSNSTSASKSSSSTTPVTSSSPRSPLPGLQNSAAGLAAGKTTESVLPPPASVATPLTLQRQTAISSTPETSNGDLEDKIDNIMKLLDTYSKKLEDVYKTVNKKTERNTPNTPPSSDDEEDDEEDNDNVSEQERKIIDEVMEPGYVSPGSRTSRPSATTTASENSSTNVGGSKKRKKKKTRSKTRKKKRKQRKK